MRKNENPYLSRASFALGICIYTYKWHTRPGSNTNDSEQMILEKTLNMVIRFQLNSLSREVNFFLDLDLDLDLDLKLGQWLSRHV